MARRLSREWPSLSPQARARWVDSQHSYRPGAPRDLIADFATRRAVLAWHDGQIARAREHVAHWPHLAGPRDLLDYCLHQRALAKQRFYGVPAGPAPVRRLSGQDCYIEAVMAIPLPPVRTAGGLA